MRLLNAYSARVMAAAEHDSVLSNQFLRVAVFVDPPAKLLHPGVLRRVLIGNLRGRRPVLSGCAPQ